MTLIELVAKFCRRTGIPVPPTVTGSTDKQITQVLGLLEEEGNDLAHRHQWKSLTLEAPITTIASEDQGDIDGLATNGFDYILNGTLYDRSTSLPLYGPVNSQDWQAIKAANINGINYLFRFRGGHLLVNPAPPIGHDWRFEYISRNWIINGLATKEFFTSDLDSFLLPDNLLLLGLRWRWKAEKGLDYAESFNTYEMHVKDAMGRDGGAPRIKLGFQGRDMRQPMIVVPSGNWLL